MRSETEHGRIENFARDALFALLAIGWPRSEDEKVAFEAKLTSFAAEAGHWNLEEVGVWDVKNKYAYVLYMLVTPELNTDMKLQVVYNIEKIQDVINELTVIAKGRLTHQTEFDPNQNALLIRFNKLLTKSRSHLFHRGGLSTAGLSPAEYIKNVDGLAIVYSNNYTQETRQYFWDHIKKYVSEHYGLDEQKFIYAKLINHPLFKSKTPLMHRKNHLQLQIAAARDAVKQEIKEFKKTTKK